MYVAFHDSAQTDTRRDKFLSSFPVLPSINILLINIQHALTLNIQHVITNHIPEAWTLDNVRFVTICSILSHFIYVNGWFTRQYVNVNHIPIGLFGTKKWWGFMTKGAVYSGYDTIASFWIYSTSTVVHPLQRG